MLFDCHRYTALAYFPLSEWPTAISTCAVAPLISIAGASGSVKLLEYLADPEDEASLHEEDLQLTAAAKSGGTVDGLLRSSHDIELHCHNVREVHFAGPTLFSAADDEVAQWDLPLVPVEEDDE